MFFRYSVPATRPSASAVARRTALSVAAFGLAAAGLPAALQAAPIEVGSGPNSTYVVFNWPGKVAEYNVHYSDASLNGYALSGLADAADPDLSLTWGNFGTPSAPNYYLDKGTYAGGFNGDGATYDFVLRPENFWHEWVSDSAAGAWSFGSGASADTFGGGDRLGWVFGEANTPVPEPTTAGLALLVLGGVALRRRRSTTAIAGRRRVAAAVLVGGSIAIAGTMNTSSASAAVFADAVVDYSAGTDITAPYQTAGTALGKPASVSGGLVITPFNPTYEATQMVGVGPGGSLTLRLAQLVPTGAGAEFGVHAGVGLIDTDFPNGQNLPTAASFTRQRSANVSVSDGSGPFVSLGHFVFDLPTNYYDQGVTLPSDQATPGTHEADFGQPFTQPLGAFNGLNWQQTQSLLDGSAGGTWIDVSPAQLSQISLIKFDVIAGERLFVDAVAAVPEPSGLTLGLAGLGLLVRRRRRTA